MKKQWKICKNPRCRKKFYREDRHNNYQWNMTLFHNRSCQVRMYNEKRRGVKKHQHPNAINFQSLHDHCNMYIVEARKRLRESVTIYDSKDMSQEELRVLVPSED